VSGRREAGYLVMALLPLLPRPREAAFWMPTMRVVLPAESVRVAVMRPVMACSSVVSWSVAEGRSTRPERVQELPLIFPVPVKRLLMSCMEGVVSVAVEPSGKVMTPEMEMEVSETEAVPVPLYWPAMMRAYPPVVLPRARLALLPLLLGGPLPACANITGRISARAKNFRRIVSKP